jgi:hypothetical protein
MIPPPQNETVFQTPESIVHLTSNVNVFSSTLLLNVRGCSLEAVVIKKIEENLFRSQ